MGWDDGDGRDGDGRRRMGEWGLGGRDERMGVGRMGWEYGTVAWNGMGGWGLRGWEGRMWMEGW